MMMIQETGYILQNTGFIMVMIYRMHSYARCTGCTVIYRKMSYMMSRMH